MDNRINLDNEEITPSGVLWPTLYQDVNSSDDDDDSISKIIRNNTTINPEKASDGTGKDTEITGVNSNSVRLYKKEIKTIKIKDTCNIGVILNNRIEPSSETKFWNHQSDKTNWSVRR